MKTYLVFLFCLHKIHYVKYLFAISEALPHRSPYLLACHLQNMKGRDVNGSGLYRIMAQILLQHMEQLVLWSGFSMLIKSMRMIPERFRRRSCRLISAAALQIDLPVSLLRLFFACIFAAVHINGRQLLSVGSPENRRFSATLSLSSLLQEPFPDNTAYKEAAACPHKNTNFSVSSGLTCKSHSRISSKASGHRFTISSSSRLYASRTASRHTPGVRYRRL